MACEEDIIKNRKVILCPNLKNQPIPSLIRTCSDCDHFMFFCCSCHEAHKQCVKKYGKNARAGPCHCIRVLFTDGACANNGRPDAIAGIGAAFGTGDDSQICTPINDENDDFPLRSSQRAELLAAIEGLDYLGFCGESYVKRNSKTLAQMGGQWIVATDSAYVVSGLTEWLPRWKKNGFLTSNGTAPANLDLFEELDEVMEKYETQNIKIGFWHIPREHNRLADRLAKEASRNGEVASSYKRTRQWQ